MLRVDPKSSNSIDDNIKATIQKVKTIKEGLIAPNETMEEIFNALSETENKASLYTYLIKNVSVKRNLNAGFDSWFVNRKEIGIQQLRRGEIITKKNNYLKWYSTATELLATDDIEKQKQILLLYFGPEIFAQIESNLKSNKKNGNINQFFTPPPPAVSNQFEEEDIRQRLFEMTSELPSANNNWETVLPSNADFAAKLNSPDFKTLHDEMGILNCSRTALIINKFQYSKWYNQFLLNEYVILNGKHFAVGLSEIQVKEKELLLNKLSTTQPNKRKNSTDDEQPNKYPRTVDSSVQEQVEIFSGFTDLEGLGLFNELPKETEITDPTKIIEALEKSLKEENTQSSLQKYGLK